MMFLFAGHSDKPLKSLISMAHEGNHICLYVFLSFTLCVQRSWTTLAGVSPVTVIASEPCS